MLSTPGLCNMQFRFTKTRSRCCPWESKQQEKSTVTIYYFSKLCEQQLEENSANAGVSNKEKPSGSGAFRNKGDVSQKFTHCHRRSAGLLRSSMLGNKPGTVWSRRIWSLAMAKDVFLTYANLLWEEDRESKGRFKSLRSQAPMLLPPASIGAHNTNYAPVLFPLFVIIFFLKTASPLLNLSLSRYANFLYLLRVFFANFSSSFHFVWECVTDQTCSTPVHNNSVLQRHWNRQGPRRTQITISMRRIWFRLTQNCRLLQLQIIILKLLQE
jgi:hypothetical protein